MNVKYLLSLTALLVGSLYANAVHAQAMYINPEGNVGVGIETPLSPLHIYREDETVEFFFLESNEVGTTKDRAMMYLANNGGIRFEFNNPALGTAWRFQAATGNQDNFEVTKVGSGQVEMRLDSVGNLTITGNYLQNSDRNVKRDIETIDGADVLTQLDQLPLAEWSYRADPEGVRHVGPMAQDFYAVFGLGSDETKIAPGDMAGVSLAAIKALIEENKQLSGQVKEQEGRLAALEAGLALAKQDENLEAKNDELEERLAQLEAAITQLLPRITQN